MTRDALAHAALAHVPKLLTLLDRNQHSPTYGCFDRNFWHYKLVDFPSGMAQEFVLPLALAWDSELADNPWFRQPALREWSVAAIRFAAKSAHSDGSSDDYYPFERAVGASAFSLLACLEAYPIFEIEDPSLLRFFERRADWLAASAESGPLANHEALVALCLQRAGALLQTRRFEAALEERLQRVLSLQDAEGWFREYEGCDPGYQTWTLSLLAWLWRLRGGNDLRDALLRGVELAAHFVHPDGSVAGEYGSRNTCNFFPHGFELIGEEHPAALRVNDRFLAGLAAGRIPCYADDHIVGHHMWNYLLAWRDYVEPRPPPEAEASGRSWFPRAGLLIDRREDWTLIVATHKGGVLKLFRGDREILSDTQFSVLQRSRRGLRNAVCHLVDAYETELKADEVVVRGSLGFAKHQQMAPVQLLISRAVMLSVGRFFPGLVRRLLQRMLIVGKQRAPFRFERRVHWRDGAWQIDDRLEAHSWHDVDAVALGCDQTSIYVATSRTFQTGQLAGWLDLSDRVAALQPGEALTLTRRPGV